MTNVQMSMTNLVLPTPPAAGAPPSPSANRSSRPDEPPRSADAPEPAGRGEPNDPRDHAVGPHEDGVPSGRRETHEPPADGRNESGGRRRSKGSVEAGSEPAGGARRGKKAKGKGKARAGADVRAAGQNRGAFEAIVKQFAEKLATGETEIVAENGKALSELADGAAIKAAVISQLHALAAAGANGQPINAKALTVQAVAAVKAKAAGTVKATGTMVAKQSLTTPTTAAQLKIAAAAPGSTGVKDPKAAQVADATTDAPAEAAAKALAGQPVKQAGAAAEEASAAASVNPQAARVAAEVLNNRPSQDTSSKNEPIAPAAGPVARGPIARAEAKAGETEAPEETQRVTTQVLPGRQSAQEIAEIGPQVQATAAANAQSVEGAGDAAGGKGFTEVMAAVEGVEVTTTSQVAGASTAAAVNGPAEARAAGSSADQIIESVRLNGARAGQQIVVRLDPPEMGRVRLVLRMEGQEVRGVLEVENPRTVAERQREASSLVQRLGESGVEMRRLDVQLSGQPRSNSGDSALHQYSNDGQGAPRREGAGQGERGPGASSASIVDEAEPERLAEQVADESINVWM